MEGRPGHQQSTGMYGQQHHMQTKGPYGSSTTTTTMDSGRTYPIVKAATAITAGSSFLILAGLTLAFTVIGLTIATPLMVIFSPVLVPAAFTISLLVAGFLASGGFGVAALSVLSWIYRYVTGKHPVMAYTLDQAGSKTSSAKEIKGKAEQIGHQTLGGAAGGHHTYGGTTGTTN